MKIGDLANRTGLSSHTIRYYERIGLLPRAVRDGSHQRAYDESILTWIAFIGRLKTTGMPIREMLRYAALRERGAATEPERQVLLERHREHVRARIAELQSCLLVLDRKIAGYAGSQQRMTADDTKPARAAGSRKPVRARQARTR